MNMNIIPGKTRIILIRMLSSHAGKRRSGLAGYSKGMLGIATALVCEFSLVC